MLGIAAVAASWSTLDDRARFELSRASFERALADGSDWGWIKGRRVGLFYVRSKRGVEFTTSESLVFSSFGFVYSPDAQPATDYTIESHTIRSLGGGWHAFERWD